jgi:hypothetical protein
MLNKQLRCEERSTLSFTARMKKAAENRKRKRSPKIAWHRLFSVGVRRQVGTIRVIMVRDAWRPRGNYGACLVPDGKSGVDGSYTGDTQRPDSEAKDDSLRDSVRSVAGRHRSFDLFSDNRTGDTGIQD